jgi:ribosome-binding protein aMBF1 (putative translation factor)
MAYVYQGECPTHVLVPIEEYEEWVKADMAQRAVTKLNDKPTNWVDADVFALRLAGERLAAARKAAGLTQKQLGEKLNVPQSQISRIERRPDHTTVRTLKRIAKALNVDVSALI